MSENITRCPQCATSFRISDAHLRSAKGSVRCGSCLHVFNAREHLISNEPEEPEFDEDFGEEEALEQEQNDSLIYDTMQMPASKVDTSDDFSNDFNENLFSPDKSKQDQNLFERDELKPIEDDEVASDESWALDLLKDDDEEETPASTKDSDSEPSDDTASDTYEYGSETPEGTGEYDTGDSYHNAFQIIDEQSSPSTQDIAQELYNEYDDVEMEEITYEDDHRASTYAQSSSHSSDYLSSIEPEPVEFDYHHNASFFQSKLFWGGLSVLAGLLIVIQIGWINFANLSVVDPYRGYYASACKVFGCTLPKRVDRSKIRAINIVVRTHPKAPNALIVDAVLQNTARFEQQFPTLDLIFHTGTEKQVLAARRVKPQDYLAGELAGRTMMPVRNPVHIAIEVADPGESATGYQLLIAN